MTIRLPPEYLTKAEEEIYISVDDTLVVGAANYYTYLAARLVRHDVIKHGYDKTRWKFGEIVSLYKSMRRENMNEILWKLNSGTQTI